MSRGTQATFQRYTDNAVSKIINLPSSCMVADVRDIYQQAWEAKLKGVTVFRYGCKETRSLRWARVKTGLSTNTSPAVIRTLASFDIVVNARPGRESRADTHAALSANSQPLGGRLNVLRQFIAGNFSIEAEDPCRKPPLFHVAAGSFARACGLLRATQG